VTVTLDDAPGRIVSLLPSLTEAVCDIGRCSALVGVDTFSNWPPPVRPLPHLGGLDDANVEAIVALHPDLVLLSASSRARPRLEALHVRVFVIEPKTLKDVQRTYERLGTLLDAEQKAAAAWERIRQGLAEAVAAVPLSQRGASVYFEVDAGPYAASEISHMGELLAMLGARNVVPGRLGSVPKLNPEFVVRADPEVIIVDARDAPSLRKRPGWDRIRAVRNGRVCALSDEQGDIVVRPGPRVAEAARILAGCLGGSVR
jgi:iron complex transport system substrate-binding protein